MEIEEISAYPVSMAVTSRDEGGIAPYLTNHNEVTEMDRVFVRVESTTGLVGWGEMRVFLSPTATVSIIEDGIAPIVEGHSPYEVESLRRLLFIEYTNVDMFFSAIEIACWDIIGKDTGKPIYELLGGWTAPKMTEARMDAQSTTDQTVDVAYCVGIMPLEESREHAAKALEEGYTVLKTKAGRDWKHDADRIIAMHDETDGELDFRLDPNQGWRLDEAVRVGARLRDAGVYLQYLEQPIRVDTHESLAKLRSRLSQPIGPNEDLYITHNLKDLIKAGALDVAVVDMTPAGGITGLRQLAAIAEDAGIPMAHHCAFDLGVRTAAILHAVSSIPGFSLPPDTTYYAWEDDVIEDPFTISDGSIMVPDDPGLGITVDESKLERYSIS